MPSKDSRSRSGSQPTGASRAGCRRRRATARCCTQIDPDSVATWYINGQPPAAGQIYRNPDLAKTFRILQEKGRDGFYKGEVARAIVAKSKALGGTMTVEDLARYTGEWVTRRRRISRLRRLDAAAAVPDVGD